MRAERLVAALAAMAAAVLLAPAGRAHKPITSPYTFNEDVFPIVRDRCAACHAPGGVAPMSLLTHGDAVPWGESIRAELMAGHMPPSGLDSAAARFRNVQGLTARELNVLLTWASGGTPAGPADQAPLPIALERRWPLGEPDAVIALPEVTIAGDVDEHVAEVVVVPQFDATRALRAVDLLPGTPAVVRSATISIKGAAADARGPGWARAESVLALWLPGDHPVPLDPGTSLPVPPGSEIVVRVRYRKTWEYERQTLTDRSMLGVYFADEPATPVRALDLTATTGGTLLQEAVQAVAIYADDASPATAVTVTTRRANGSREELIAFRPRADWARRYWFRTPIALPRGTRIDIQARSEEDLLPPGAVRPAGSTGAPTARVTLNVIPSE